MLPLRAVLRARGSKATEVWIPAQTSGAQAPCFGGLLGPAVRSAAYAATPPRFASRARGHRAHVVLGSRPKQRPSLLGLSARSALTRDARAGCALRARGHRAHVVLGSRPKQRPSLLGLSARSAFHATLGQDAPCGLGVTGRMLFWIPDQNNARRFSGFQPGLRAAASVSRTTAAGGSWAEIAFHATLGQDTPCGLGVSGHSPQAPPRWGKVRFLSVLFFHCRWMRLLARRSAYIGQPVQSGSSQAGAKNCAGEGRCSRCLTRRLSI